MVAKDLSACCRKTFQDHTNADSEALQEPFIQNEYTFSADGGNMTQTEHTYVFLAT